MLIMVSKLERINKRLVNKTNRLIDLINNQNQSYNNLLEENLHLYTELKEYQKQVQLAEEIVEEANKLQELVEEE